MERVPGSFDPPFEIRELKVCRVTGPGFLDLDERGIAVSASIADRPLPFPVLPTALGIFFAGVFLALVTGWTHVFMPIGTTTGALLWSWSLWQQRPVPVLGWRLPWSKIERVVQLPREPDKFAVLLDGAPNDPEAFYFAPHEGPEAFLERARGSFPKEIPIDTGAAALAALYPEANEEEE